MRNETLLRTANDARIAEANYGPNLYPERVH